MAIATITIIAIVIIAMVIIANCSSSMHQGSFDEVMAFAFKQCLMSFVWWLFENPCHHVGDR
jgi:hypothetical protein